VPWTGDWTRPRPTNGSKLLYFFENCTLDTDRRELRRDSDLVAVEPQVFDILEYLVRHRDRVVSRDDLIGAIWGGRIVSESALTARISAVRTAVGDCGAEQRVIKTFPRKGVRFIGAVREDRTSSERPFITVLPFEGQHAQLGVPQPVAATTAGKPRLPLPDKPSIAVLPFANLSPDPEQEYFVDGIANDVITALSRYPSLLVIARNSSFSYKGIDVNVQRIGRELGVRYVLEGSVRKVDARVRVTSQLIETESGTHIWANRYDANVTDIFAVQDEITHAVSTAIAPAVADAERHRAVRKPPDKQDSWSAYQRGLWHLSRATPEENKTAQRCFAEAIAIDANFSGGYTGLALAQMQESGLFATRPVAEARISIKALALRAVANDESDAEAHACLSWALNFDGDYEGALAEARRALTISPNLASAHRALGTTLIFAGEPRQGLVATETSIRLDPRDPLLPWHINRVAIANYFAGDYEAAVEAARRVVRLYPDFPLIYRWLAAALGQIGRVEEARCALNKAITIFGGSFDMYVRERVPWHRAEDYEHMLDGLRKAGWRG
jgi:adenylate cyclase